MMDEFLSVLPPKSCVMVLGDAERAASVVRLGHRGVLVSDLRKNQGLGSFGPNMDVIDVRLGFDPCMVKMLDGYWIRPITLSEIINQLPGPYQAVLANVSDRNRQVMLSPTLNAMFPLVAALPEDGHNEGIVTHYRARGYNCDVVDGWLVMRRHA